MKLIHCSDLHLDSRMETNLPAEKARQRNREICQTFVRLVQYAMGNGVSVIMIAGDLFDTQRISATTAGIVLDAITHAPDIDFLYLCGNHDESTQAFRSHTLPDNLKRFSSDWTSYTYGDVTISGVELTGDNYQAIYDSLPCVASGQHIVMLHGQVSSAMGEEEICLNALKNKGIHYLALGHLHSYQQSPLDAEGVYCYCGCLEGRGFDECGEKGFIELNTDSGILRSKFVPFAYRTLHEVSVDITDKTTAPELARAIAAAGSDISAQDLVKFTLTGQYTLDTQKDLRYLADSIQGAFYFAKVKDESHLQLAPEDYIHDVSLKGAFLRLVMASDRSEEEKERMITCGIQALRGEEVML